MRTLDLKQRLARVREALNAKTVRFQDELPTEELKDEFHRLMLGCIAVIDGADVQP